MMHNDLCCLLVRDGCRILTCTKIVLSSFKFVGLKMTRNCSQFLCKLKLNKLSLTLSATIFRRAIYSILEISCTNFIL